MSGERDWTEIAKEVSMSLTTIYNVTGELTKLGQPLAIHQRLQGSSYFYFCSTYSPDSLGRDSGEVGE